MRNIYLGQIKNKKDWMVPKLTIKNIFNDMCEYYEKQKNFKYFNSNSIKR